MPILASKLNSVLFIDEAHFVSVDMWKQHGWFLKGSMPLAFRQNLWKRQSCSLVMAIGTGGIVLSAIKEHAHSFGVNEMDFHKFLVALHRKTPKVFLFPFFEIISRLISIFSRLSVLLWTTQGAILLQ